VAERARSEQLEKKLRSTQEQLRQCEQRLEKSEQRLEKHVRLYLFCSFCTCRFQLTLPVLLYARQRAESKKVKERIQAALSRPVSVVSAAGDASPAAPPLPAPKHI
jgi:hypothetical protein